MPSMKVIKRRISSVSATRQVMKAMDMVASTKLKKTRQRLDAARPLYEESLRMIDSLKGSREGDDNIFVKPDRRAAKCAVYIVVTGDRGLCGSYNVNVSEKALESMRGKNVKIVAAGIKGAEYFRRRGKEIMTRLAGVSEGALYEDAVKIGSELISLYTSGEVNEAYIAYTHFESSLSYVPRIVKILPVGGERQDSDKSAVMRYEPDIESFLKYAIPMYINTLIYSALVESSTCEQAARMVSMGAASKNAEDIIDDLTHTHNRLRQASITQEINEIISGANMLN